MVHILYKKMSNRMTIRSRTAFRNFEREKERFWLVEKKTEYKFYMCKFFIL